PHPGHSRDQPLEGDPARRAVRAADRADRAARGRRGARVRESQPRPPPGGRAARRARGLVSRAAAPRAGRGAVREGRPAAEARADGVAPLRAGRCRVGKRNVCPPCGGEMKSGNKLRTLATWITLILVPLLGYELLSNRAQPSPLHGAIWVLVGIACVLGLFVFVLRRAGGGAASALELRKSRARLVAEAPGVTFAHVGGCAEAKAELAAPAAFLKTPET